METQIRYGTGRTARARIRGGCLLITLPRHWPRAEQEKTLAKFKRWAQKHAQSLHDLPPAEPAPPLPLEHLQAAVETLNRETLNVPYHGVRIGRSRYTRLAQVNLKTRILTFSRYAIDGLPERALRYLILHELAHLIVPDHSKRFWALVARYEPDYRNQRRIAQAHYQRMASLDEPPLAPLLASMTPVPAPPLSDPMPVPSLTPRLPKATEPAQKKAPPAKKTTGRDASQPVQLSLFNWL